MSDPLPSRTGESEGRGGDGARTKIDYPTVVVLTHSSFVYTLTWSGWVERVENYANIIDLSWKLSNTMPVVFLPSRNVLTNSASTLGISAASLLLCGPPGMNLFFEWCGLLCVYSELGCYDELCVMYLPWIMGFPQRPCSRLIIYAKFWFYVEFLSSCWVLYLQ